MEATKLYIFTPNGNTSSSNFLGDPFLPLNIASSSDQYASVQLLTILSIDAESCPFYSAVHKEQLFNAANMAQSQVENSLTFTIPADDPAAQYVVEGNLVAFKDLDGNFQLFEMLTPQDFHDALLYRQVIAINAGQSELADEWITHLAVSNLDAASTLTQVLNGTRWQVGQVDDLGLGSVTIDRANVLAGFQGLLNGWGGELRFRVTMNGSRISGMYVDWLSRRGQVTGKRFVFGKDMNSDHRTVDLSNLKTALRGYGKQDSAGNYLTFTNVTWSTANGDPADKPPGQDWVGDPGALSQWGRAGGTRHRYGEFVDSSQTDPTVLLQQAWDALQSITTPLISYQMSVVDLEQVAGLSHEAARIGDTVAAIDTLVNPVLREQARIVELDRDLIDPLNTQVVLGNFLPSTVNTDTQVSNLQSQVNSIQGGSIQVGDPINGSQLQGTIDLLKAALQNSQAYIYTTQTDGILALDKPMDQSPTKALKIGGGIFGIASSKNPDGTWDWSTFGTGAGFVADYINTGTLDASKVNVTNLNASNVKTGTLDASLVAVVNLNASNIKTGTLDASVVTVKNLNASNITSGTFTAGGTNNTDIIAKDANGNTIMTVDNTGLALYDSSGVKRFWSILVNVGSNNTIGTTEAWGALYGISTTNFKTDSTIFFGAQTADNIWVLAANPNGKVNTAYNVLDDGSGNMTVYQTLTVDQNFAVKGSKSAAVDTKSHGTRLLYAVEAPENWFEDFGEGQVGKSGQVKVRFEKIFKQTIDVSKLDYKVFIQGVDSHEFKVPERTETGFSVEGPPGARFMYRIIAKRIGFADLRLEKHQPKQGRKKA